MVVVEVEVVVVVVVGGCRGSGVGLRGLARIRPQSNLYRSQQSQTFAPYLILPLKGELLFLIK